jgi:ribose/xylose/arabinose/galactoside ABC-type transport system permease subunit
MEGSPRASLADRMKVWRRVRIPAGRQVVNVIGLLMIVAVFSTLSPYFLTPDNIINVLKQTAAVATVGGFFTLMMVAGGVDLSVSGVLVLGGVISVILVNRGVSLPVAFSAAVAVGLLVGIVNGLLVAVARINTVIATLGTLYITSGLTQVWTKGLTVAPRNFAYVNLGNGSFLGVPILVIVMAISVAAALVIERRTILGRHAVLTGSNTGAAVLSGIPTRFTLAVLFALTGAAAGWAGVMVSSQLGAADPFADTTFAFEIIIATLLGGTSILGGEGSVLGMLLGALIVSSATVGMQLLGIPSFVETVLTGLILLGAMTLDALSRRYRLRPRRQAVQRAI